jgi:adenylyltransferase/sulfurtransferase
MDPIQPNQNRYQRQILLPQIGAEGQARLGRARAMILGCGALGTVMAEALVRAGLGFLRIVDRDLIELNNLQRQVLFDEEDARQSLPKSIAAAKRLRQINSTVTVDPLVLDVHSGNIEELLDVDLILDGTDNAETRYLLNDAAIKHARPWVYGACVGTEGRVLAIIPGKTACLRCIFPDAPVPGQLPTCDTAGVLSPVAGVVASLQAVIAIKILSGNVSAVAEELISLDLWTGRLRSISTAQSRRPDCPCCGLKRFEFLDRRDAADSVSLCGRRAVQIRPSRRAFSFEQAAARLEAVGRVEKTPYFTRCALADPQGVLLTVFPDGRIIVGGVDDVSQARSIAARFVGN